MKTPAQQQDKARAPKKWNKDKTNTDTERHKMKYTRLDLAV